ncbi:MAG: iron-sulfur cluster assembly protein [Bacteroidales bacterium]|nr:iron-sulfur cluster assembly protein [Bacteroidales bacterium]
MTEDEEKELKRIQDEVIETLKTVYDPEIPADIYNLGLIYDIKYKLPIVEIDMTLTSPTCPMGEMLEYEIQTRLKLIRGIEDVAVNLVFEPEWNQDMMSEEAKLKTGLL